MLLNQASASEIKSPNYRSLIVSIQNNGAGSCQLAESTLTKGKLLHSNLPRILEASKEKFYFTLHGAITELTVKYNCDYNKSIVLYMKQIIKNGHNHTSIQANSLNYENISETHKKTTGYIDAACYDEVRPCDSFAGRLDWVITH